MNPREPVTACVDPDLAELATPYCFGGATERQRLAFELHLTECDACWREVARLEAAVRLLRSDMALAHTLTPRDIAGLLGLSASLDRPFGGHRRHAIVVSVMHALLFAVPVLVEVAYQWDRYGRGALVLTPLVFAWMLAATLTALAVDVRQVRIDGRGLLRALGVLAAATIVLCIVVVPLAPSVPTVKASFQTYPVNLAYLKSVFYAWCVGPVFLLWPFHFILVMQRQLVLGRHRATRALLAREPHAVPPPGVRYPLVWVLTLYGAGLFTFNWIGLSHLFDHLEPGPYSTMFMALVLTRVSVWLLLPVVCIWWYQGCLNELKRECTAVLSFGDDV